MIEDITNNISNLSKYDKDKRQLKHSDFIISILEKKHSLIQYIHPAIIFKNGSRIIDIVGDSIKYLKYIPNSIINKNQDILYKKFLKNPQVLKYINSSYQLQYKEEIIPIVIKNPKLYDYLTIELKDNELFNTCIKKLYKLEDEYTIQTLYELSLDNTLISLMIEPLLDKELLLLLNNSLSYIIKYKEILNKLNKLYQDKYRYKTFKNLLRIYSNNNYIYKYIDKIITLLETPSNLYKELYKDSLSINEIKTLYYLLSSNKSINTRTDFYNYQSIREKYLDSLSLESIKDYKNIIYEYKYAFNYIEVKNLIKKYSSDIKTLLNRYKKYKYNIEEIDEYETLLILSEMIKLDKNNNIEELKDILEEESINMKMIKSFDIRINLEDDLKNIYHKEYTKKWNKRLTYKKERIFNYEELVSKNKLLKDYIGKKVEINIIDDKELFNILISNNIDYNKYLNTYKNINYEYLNIDSNIYYRFTNIDYHNILELNEYSLDGIYSDITINTIPKLASIITFNKPDNQIIKLSIDNNVPIEILDKKKVEENTNNIIKSINNKILHYLNNDIEYEEIPSLEKYTPIKCIRLLFKVLKNTSIANNKKVDKYILNILKNIPNPIIAKQVLEEINNNLYILNNLYNKIEINKEIDKVYRKHNLYKKNNILYEDIIYLLKDDLEYIKLSKKYNKNQLQYKKYLPYIDFNFIYENTSILIDNFYQGNIDIIIIQSILANILAKYLKYDIDAAILGIMYSNISKVGAYNASIFRPIYKNKLNKEDLNIICSSLDIQDSKETLGSIKTKYKLKNLDNTLKLANIIKDITYITNYKYKRNLIEKDSTRLLKIRDTLIRVIYNYRLNELLNKKIINTKEYTTYLENEINIEDICKII